MDHMSDPLPSVDPDTYELLLRMEYKNKTIELMVDNIRYLHSIIRTITPIGDKEKGIIVSTAKASNDVADGLPTPQRDDSVSYVPHTDAERSVETSTPNASDTHDHPLSLLCNESMSDVLRPAEKWSIEEIASYLEVDINSIKSTEDEELYRTLHTHGTASVPFDVCRRGDVPYERDGLIGEAQRDGLDTRVDLQTAISHSAKSKQLLSKKAPSHSELRFDVMHSFRNATPAALPPLPMNVKKNRVFGKDLKDCMVRKDKKSLLTKWKHVHHNTWRRFKSNNDACKVAKELLLYTARRNSCDMSLQEWYHHMLKIEDEWAETRSIAAS